MRILAKGRAPGARFGCLVLATSAALYGCHVNQPPEEHFYDVHIQPILTNFCVGNTSPCHRPDSVTGTTALGNLDLSSFEGVQKRRDVLRTYGSYPQPLLLLKTLPEADVQIPYQQSFYFSEIRHTGGKPIALNSNAYNELKRWLDNGANRDGIAPQAVPNMGTGVCSVALPPASQRPAVDTTTQAYKDFVAYVEPVLESSCAFGATESAGSARVIDRMGPFAIVFLHALWEQSAVASGLPDSLASLWHRYRDDYVAKSKVPTDRRYLEVHEGHLIYLKPGEEKFVDENLVRTMTLTGSAEEIIERIKGLEAAGVKQISIQVVQPYGREMIEDFGRKVIAKY